MSKRTKVFVGVVPVKLQGENIETRDATVVELFMENLGFAASLR